MICCFLTTPAQQKPIIALVDTRLKQVRTSVLAAKKDDPQADTSKEEVEIDRIVYQLYGLTGDDVKIIESANRM